MYGSHMEIARKPSNETLEASGFEYDHGTGWCNLHHADHAEVWGSPSYVRMYCPVTGTLLNETPLHVVHYQTGSSTVACGAPMRDAHHPDGWDLGTVTVEPWHATCSSCLRRRFGYTNPR